MILETRSIIFSDDELVLALRPLLGAKGHDAGQLPDRVLVEENERDEVVVSYHFQQGNRTIVFNSREVGAAIVNHCIEQGVPLPRGAYKELAVRGEHIALIVRLESGAMGTGIENDEE